MSEFWERLSVREQRLALTTAAIVLAAVAAFLAVRAVGRVRELNRTVARLERTLLLSYETLETRGVSVDKAFVEVAAQHSSAWTEAEIHNRLREEIYRLSNEDADAPPDATKKLVDIPRLLQGTLKEGGTGYREYQLSIKIPSSDIYSIVMFLMRLQDSPQTLRIDGLDIARSPESQAVSATINVTRTVVEGAPAGEALAAAAETVTTPKIAEWEGNRTEDWRGEGCDLSIVSEIGELAAVGGGCLKIQTNAPEAAAFMAYDVETATTYELTLDAAASADAALQVANDADGRAFEGEQALPGDGKMYQYRVLFTAPGEPGQKVRVRAPVIAVKGADVQVYVDNVVLRKAAS